MQEKKIVKKYNMFLRTKYFIVVEGYNPRIHALYFCPQLFRHDSGKLVPLEGPMQASEVISCATSAWNKTIKGENWIGRGRQRQAEIDSLSRTP
jgi:hypothetical protein